MAFRFGAFEVNDEAFELRRGGIPVRVEPRVFEVLLYLVRNRDRVVSKEELIEQVWQAKFVSESALTRAIMELRRVLPEDAIKTVHRRGYRFVAELASEAEPVATSSPPARAPAVAPSGSVRRWILAAVIAVVLMGTAIAWRRTRESPSEPSQPIRVAVLPVAVDGDAAQLHLLALSIGDLLSSRLDELPRLAIRRPEVNAALSFESPSIGDLARRAGVHYVVSSSVGPSTTPEKARFIASLHEIDENGRVRNTPLGEYDLPFVSGSADIRHFRAMRDSVTAAIVRKLGPAIDLPRDGSGPTNAEAYRFYLLGKERLSRAACEGETSLALLERSLELDPNFAPAWEAFGLAHYGLASSCGQEAAHYTTALAALDRAKRLTPAAPSVVSLTAMVLTETGKAREAVQLIARADTHESADVEYAASYALCHLGEIDAAVRRLDRSLMLSPSYLTDAGWTPNAYLYKREYARFLELLPATDSPLFRFYRGYVQFLMGERGLAAATLGPAFRLNPSDVFARLSQALLAIIEGRGAEAREVLRQLQRERAAVGATNGEVTYKIAKSCAIAGDADAAASELAQAVEQGFVCRLCFESDPTWKGISQNPKIAAIVKSSRNPH